MNKEIFINKLKELNDIASKNNIEDCRCAYGDFLTICRYKRLPKEVLSHLEELVNSLKTGVVEYIKTSPSNDPYLSDVLTFFITNYKDEDECNSLLPYLKEIMYEAIPTFDLLVNIILIYQSSRYPWRARKYVLELEKLEQKSVIKYETLARFYQNVHDFVKAYYAYIDLFALTGSNSYLSKAMNLRDNMPEEYKPEIDLGLIDESKPRVANALYLKVDPIEYSPKFLSVFDEVMEEVEAEIDKEGDLHIPQQRWGIMYTKFLEKGINWKDPTMMNPGTMFD